MYEHTKIPTNIATQREVESLQILENKALLSNSSQTKFQSEETVFTAESGVKMNHIVQSPQFPIPMPECRGLVVQLHGFQSSICTPVNPMLVQIPERLDPTNA